jgi:hypothetical protein
MESEKHKKMMLDFSMIFRIYWLRIGDIIFIFS